MLQYDQPIGQDRPEPRQAATPAGFDVLELARLLWRRKAAIAMAALICACAAVMIGKSLTPKYSATTQLYVDPRELQLVDRELTPRAQDISGLSMVVESQARLITSNNVLLQVIKDTNLDKDPEFGGDGSKGLTASLLGLFGLAPGPAGEDKLGQMAALDTLNRHIYVKKTDRSFIVDLDVWSRDPAKAAMLANAIASAYMAETKKSQATAARRATTDLSGRLKELQERLRNAENTLATYKAQNNFVGTQDALISDQQLSASNQRLAAARALTLDAQAKYDQIEAIRRASADGGAIPEALQSPTIANLRAQYAEARKRSAELTGELGPLHPALRQIQKQVDDLRRTINEEVDRFAQSSKNDLTRARDYEASLNKALEAQKRQSVQLSQASVRLRELERDVETSRDVYLSFLKRSRETEEQESLNTSSARIIGEATEPRQRIFPPPMSLLAMIGLMFGGLAAAGWIVAADRMSTGAPQRQPERPATVKAAPPPEHRTGETPGLQPADAPVEKPAIARLQPSDVMRSLGGILAAGGPPDLTRMGWPALRPDLSAREFLDAVREMRAGLTARVARGTPVMGVIGAGASEDRAVAALNIALAIARDGAKVLLIDADHGGHGLSDKVHGPEASGSGRSGWFGLGARAKAAIKTANGIWVLPAARQAGAAVCKDIARASAEGTYDIIIVDGPPLPWSEADGKLLDTAGGLVAVLPANLDVNDCLEEIITALDGAEHKLIGVVLNELDLTNAFYQRARQYA